MATAPPTTQPTGTSGTSGTSVVAAETGPIQIGDLVLREAAVVDVADGDSLLVALGDGQERVRLIGINAPELDECLGADARDSLASMVGRAVTVGEAGRDQFDRLLAHVFVGRGYINRAQVERGLAIAVSGDHDFAPDLRDAQELARTDAAGLWSGSSCGGAPLLTGVEITGVVADPPGPDDAALGDETVEITNTTGGTADLSGWVLRDESTANRYIFAAGTVLEPGESLVVASGCDAPEGRLTWCAGGPVWNNDGDSAILLDADGRIAAFARTAD